MARLTDYAGELAQGIGPRPFGTQQEQEAADLIKARFDGFGLPVDIDEFTCSSIRPWVRIAYLFIAVVAAELLFFMPKLHILSLVLILLAVALMVLDVLELNPLYTMFKDSLSQNVVARHVPAGMAESSRNRKVVVLAHYDSTRVRVQAVPFLAGFYALIRMIVGIALLAVFLFAILSFLSFLPEIVQTILRILTCIAGIPIALYLLAEVANRLLPYNSGANCNAAGVAVLYGVAERLASGGSGGGRTGRSRNRSRRGATPDSPDGDSTGTGAALPPPVHQQRSASADPNSTGELTTSQAGDIGLEPGVRCVQLHNAELS